MHNILIGVFPKFYSNFKTPKILLNSLRVTFQYISDIEEMFPHISSSLSYFLQYCCLLVHVSQIYMGYPSFFVCRLVTDKVFFFTYSTRQWFSLLPNLMRFLFDVSIMALFYISRCWSCCNNPFM